MTENPVQDLKAFSIATFPDLCFRFYDSIVPLLDIWNELIPRDEYWHSDYHAALEASPPADLKPYYVLVCEGERPIGLIYLQWKKIHLKESIRVEGASLWSAFKKFILRFLKNNTLVVGNLLLTGKYGFYFKKDWDIDQQLEVVHAIASEVVKILRPQVGFSTILMKDFFEEEVQHIDSFQRYVKFSVQPNMMMQVRPNWNVIDAYSNDLKAKARTRYKRTLGKLSPLVCNELSYNDIVQYKSELKKLYLNIAGNASFNLFFLNEDYFPSLKEKMEERFKIFAYFDKSGKMAGFYSVVINHDHLDAHFLGYDAHYNKENLLYLNMLFNMVAQGIGFGLNKICMSRTAIEIKSSVGAEPVNMFCFLTHLHPWLNLLVGPVIKMLYKDEEWTERNPFKEN